MSFSKDNGGSGGKGEGAGGQYGVYDGYPVKAPPPYYSGAPQAAAPNVVPPNYRRGEYGYDGNGDGGYGYPPAPVYAPNSGDVSGTGDNFVGLQGIPLYGDPSVAANPHLRRFVKNGWKDVWAGVLFMMFFLMVIIWGIVNIARNVTDGFVFGGSDSGIAGDISGWKNSPLAIVLFVALSFLASFCTAAFTMMLIQWFPRGIIYIANILTVLLFIAMGVLSFIYSTIESGVVSILLAVLTLLCFYFGRHRIPFTAAVLKSSSVVLSRYKSIFVFQFLSLVVTFGFMILWTYALVPSIQKAENDTSTGLDIFIFCLFAFTFYWVVQVIPNVMHVMTAGVVATWYFVGFDNMPSFPTLKSFGRAITTSFGSVCFGSLLVAVIQFLRWLIASGNNGQDGFLACCLMCLLGCIESLIRQFNSYAFVHVAIYGYDYITAARHTFELIQQCVCAVLFQNCLLEPTLNILTLVLSIVIGVVLGLIFWSAEVGIIAGIVSVMVHSLFFTAVSSAATTIFVCFAEVPEALAITDPILYQVFVATDRGGTRNNAVA